MGGEKKEENIHSKHGFESFQRALNPSRFRYREIIVNQFKNH